MKVTKKEALNIPNILCYIRILLIPFFCYYLITADSDNLYRYAIGAGLIVLSGITDLFDGLIARRCNMITDLGKAIDPIADKLTQFSIAVCLTIKIPYMIYLVLIVFVKEIAMGILCLILLKQNKKLDGAMWFGKVATAVYYAAMFLIIVLTILDANPVWNVVLISIASVFMLFSFGMYLPVFYRLYKK
ncbi:CDP-alcohol phosphatidyltransferase family protein [Paludicola sp. MB14-C6]|uniref:CDP-alcohol phosphatidyltransferase family protein n=1 Tax=Paludihabitans sp. MB14-C6 TaxID=3070656 RepID=UPI0027DEA10D|nr:CDP-alcohol phosphatidyltransferase family protein [Paludicola sp. MB14-C6]WMJ24416.1 CDP-alcohol phosphatidyltransferase family protein [Paludicola sp. MB14-C6]